MLPGNTLPNLRLQFDANDVAGAKFGLFHHRPRSSRLRFSDVFEKVGLCRKRCKERKEHQGAEELHADCIRSWNLKCARRKHALRALRVLLYTCRRRARLKPRMPSPPSSKNALPGSGTAVKVTSFP